MSRTECDKEMADAQSDVHCACMQRIKSMEEMEASVSAWCPATQPPTKDEWVVVSADGMVRCVAWNNAVKKWQDCGNTGIILEDIEWWMPIPDVPNGTVDCSVSCGYCGKDISAEDYNTHLFEIHRLGNPSPCSPSPWRRMTPEEYASDFASLPPHRAEVSMAVNGESASAEVSVFIVSANSANHMTSPVKMK